MHIPYIDIEVKVIILTKRGRVVRDLREHGKIKTVKLFMERYKCGLKPAYDYVKKVEGEIQRAKSN